LSLRDERVGFDPSLMPQKRLDKSVVIIGGTSGMGLSAAVACKEAGARLVVVGRDAESTEFARRQLGDLARCLVGDATNPETAERAVVEAVEQFGRLDALYHVAGGSGRKFGDGPLHEVTDEGIDWTLALNLKSVIFSNRVAVRQFLKQNDGGAILNMGSVLGSRPSPKFFATHIYAAAKSALIGFTRSCAAYYAKDNIRFNLIAPSLIETPMAQRASGDETIQRFLSTKQPLDGGRIGRPADLDEAVLLFLGDGSSFITGQVLSVDGGWSISEGQIPSSDQKG
jgi:NAD(P)-dependent dehydrogenase (short-subunit alcohol dehydrogenase family)